ncbi:hypothetical protein Pogu_2100 [Pyrobaculum oguniense TE7]|uniref:Uncharacterized protein n=1 Tax=Pyrobaculum oguniense (strain DSM 13380 / JCM 10595 / TE7) TaxID=698757 RepID=H6QCT1_PYROT|nr:hypothetical protein Pogu_2100 [Pyrobaculum oguniense TE7]
MKSYMSACGEVREIPLDVAKRIITGDLEPVRDMVSCVSPVKLREGILVMDKLGVVQQVLIHGIDKTMKEVVVEVWVALYFDGAEKLIELCRLALSKAL